MLKIGDFSKLCCVSIKTLRFYDEVGLLRPASVDRFSLGQLPRLNRIAQLLPSRWVGSTPFAIKALGSAGPGGDAAEAAG